MTGFDPVKDRILEVACIATDFDLVEIATYQASVKVPKTLMTRRMIGDFWEKFSTVRDALIANSVEQGRPTKSIESDLLKFLDDHFDSKQPTYLAGNSIHHDRKFVAHEWPTLDARLHYRMLDVSAWKIIFEQYRQKFTKPESHRALEDIRGSIEELKFYLKGLK